jgi:glucose-6-phosphate 1-dehydrogenase
MKSGENTVATAVAPMKKSSRTAADPCTIVIFGASGDLSRRKLIPALYSLASQNCLARRFAIIGFARTPMTDDAFQKSAVDSIKQFGEPGTNNDEIQSKEFAQALAYVSGEYQHPETFETLKNRLEELDPHQSNEPFVLSGDAADVYPVIIEQLHKAGLAKNPTGNPGSYNHRNRLAGPRIGAKLNKASSKYSTAAGLHRSLPGKIRCETC